MDPLILAALITMVSSHAAISYAAYKAGYVVRDMEALSEALNEINEEIGHAERVRSRFDETVASVDARDDASLDRMLHDSAGSALGDAGVSS